MNHTHIKFTKEGYQKLKSDFEQLIQKRKGAVINLRTAREMGDLSENGAYKAARFELSSIDREIRRLTYLIRFGGVTKITHTGVVSFGNYVTLHDGIKQMKFMLVDGFESNPWKHKLSIRSPIGKSVLGKRVGDIVKVIAPRGQTEYTIIEIK